MKLKLFLLVSLCFILPVLYVNAQSAERELPLRRISLFSSGVGFFEHSGNISSSGPTVINLPFDAEAVNDVLKSLVINDPASASPSVRYATENSLWRSLRSLNIDLSGRPGIGEILNGLRGAELEVHAPNPIRGRIIGVEHRQRDVFIQGVHHNFPHQRPSDEAWLSLFTPQGIRVIAVNDIASFIFIDERINADLNRALDIIMATRDETSRNLQINLDGTGNRNVTVSYVIPTPVWKVSYRLDLSGPEPFLQGWAIVDNDSDVDWKNVQLSLVAGRPVSFIQNLFPPYRVFRPFIPLAIAGVAQARVHESGILSRVWAAERDEMAVMEMAMDAPALMRAPAPPAAQAAPALAGGVLQTAAARAAADQFEFTIRNPVTLERRQSAMLPLVEGSIRAERVLVFSGSRARGAGTIHPELSAELTNTSGMRLPAGPITVFDGGTFAGNALLEFFPENERRLISYGEDLTVTGYVRPSATRNITAVTISGGVMTITHRHRNESIYTIRNASNQAKRIIIEHPITQGAELVEPQTADDRTPTLYRFNRNLPANGTLSFMVREDTPRFERITLAQMRPETFLSFSTNHEIPANVRAALTRAIELRRIVDQAVAAQGQLENQLARLISEQDRIRRNLQAAGNQTPQGQEYLRRLVSLDNDIDNINRRIDEAIQATQTARREFDNYLATLNI